MRLKNDSFYSIKEQEVIFSLLLQNLLTSISVASDSVLFHHTSDDEAVLNAWNLIPFCLSQTDYCSPPSGKRESWGVWSFLVQGLGSAGGTLPHILPSPAFLPALEV